MHNLKCMYQVVSKLKEQSDFQPIHCQFLPAECGEGKQQTQEWLQPRGVWLQTPQLSQSHGGWLGLVGGSGLCLACPWLHGTCPTAVLCWWSTQDFCKKSLHQGAFQIFCHIKHFSNMATEQLHVQSCLRASLATEAHVTGASCWKWSSLELCSAVVTQQLFSTYRHSASIYQLWVGILVGSVSYRHT